MAIAAVILAALSQLPLQAEFVFLKDGSILEGTIVTDAADTLTLRVKDEKIKKIPRDNIMRLLYTRLKMGKIYIQRRDGKGVVAFIVDEDQESYTFRKELYSPEEFIINRSEVLFLAEKNPSGLQVDGSAGTDRVSLKWLPPYGEVKKYNLYLKKNDKDKYELIDSTWSKSITLKNLTSNTNYFLIVTSIDSEGYESTPSNELKIKTANIPPAEPEITSSGDIKSDERNIIWNGSIDTDGKVEKYRIYGTQDHNRTIIAEIMKTEYFLRNALSYTKVEIAAVDDKGDESVTAEVNLLPETTFEIQPGLIIPLGKFKNMFNPGYGGMLSFSENNLFFKNFTGGVALGFYYMKGNDLMTEKDKDYHNFILVPLYLTSGYNYGIGESLKIKPLLSFGSAYMDVKYKDASSPAKPNKHLQIISPAFKAGIAAKYSLTEYISFSAGCEYGAIIQNNGVLNSIYVNAGIGYSF